MPTSPTSRLLLPQRFRRESCIDAVQVRKAFRVSVPGLRLRASLLLLGLHLCRRLLPTCSITPDSLLRPHHIEWQAAGMDSFAGASNGNIPIPPLSSELNAPFSYASGFWSSTSTLQQPSPGAFEAEDSPVNGEEHHRPAAKKASPSLSASSSSSASNASKRKQFSSCDACVSAP